MQGMQPFYQYQKPTVQYGGPGSWLQHQRSTIPYRAPGNMQNAQPFAQHQIPSFPVGVPGSRPMQTVPSLHSHQRSPFQNGGTGPPPMFGVSVPDPPITPKLTVPKPAHPLPAQTPARPPGYIENEKLVRCQHQLALLLHGETCQYHGAYERNLGAACPTDKCHKLKELIAHIRVCKDGKFCGEANCFSARQMLYHWKNCQKSDCRICGPVMKLLATAEERLKRINSNPSDPNLEPNSSELRKHATCLLIGVLPRIQPPAKEKQAKKKVKLEVPSEKNPANVVKRARKTPKPVKTNLDAHALSSDSKPKVSKPKKATKAESSDRPERKRKRPSKLDSPDYPHKTPKVARVEISSPKKETPVQIRQFKPVPRQRTVPGPNDDTHFTANELKAYLSPVLEKICKYRYSLDFQYPVDPVILKCPDYFNIVRRPMDLSTMRYYLENDIYLNVWEFCKDMYQIFDNTFLYNNRESNVYRNGSMLLKRFTEIIQPVMLEMGYCCVDRQTYTQLTLFCQGNVSCTVPQNAEYMVYEHRTPGEKYPERYIYCMDCFKKLPSEGAKLPIVNISGIVPKSQFEKRRDEIVDEPLVTCKECSRGWHRICAKYDEVICPGGFICPNCCAEKNLHVRRKLYTAKNLPHNELSKFLEAHVNTFLHSRKGSTADVIIRNVCVDDKELNVKSEMVAKFAPEGFPAKFRYRTKVILAFQENDGDEVCFFALYVQEYDDKCPQPNTRRVYISYLDSVNFFQPKEYRTDVYHQLLLGYLDYVKHLGYESAHLWAYPPTSGEDYIFNCHPQKQKMPRPKRLHEWYETLLEKGIKDKILVHFHNGFVEEKDEHRVTPMSVPYFDGDFWPDMMEKCISDANTDEAEMKKLAMSEDEEPMVDEHHSSMSKKNKLKKRTPKRAAQNRRDSLCGKDASERLAVLLERHRKVFFTVHLLSSEEALHHKPIDDPDSAIKNAMMDTRTKFITRAQHERWEFSSLRRAKYSTLVLCRELHGARAVKAENSEVGNESYHAREVSGPSTSTTSNSPHQLSDPMLLRRMAMLETYGPEGSSSSASIASTASCSSAPECDANLEAEEIEDDLIPEVEQTPPRVPFDFSFVEHLPEAIKEYAKRMYEHLRALPNVSAKRQQCIEWSQEQPRLYKAFFGLYKDREQAERPRPPEPSSQRSTPKASKQKGSPSAEKCLSPINTNLLPDISPAHTPDARPPRTV